MRAGIQQSHQNTEHRTGAYATARNKPDTQDRKEECHDEMAKHEAGEVRLKIGFRSEKRRHFVMRALHQHPVPNEAKKEKKDERCDECDEEFLPVHDLYD
jgi:formylmethanofuran dehydrogenase subunit E